MKPLFIGDIAKKFGLNPRTIRYYERIRILPKAGRTESGYRIYSDETIERLEFILKAKSLSLKLNEIKEILLFYEKGMLPCECTRKFIGNKTREIEEKIASLIELKTRLRGLLKPKKHKPATRSICPIIES